MDLGDPTRSITAALDGPVLAALAVAADPMTVSEVAARSARGSEIGVRRTLARLTEQGLVRVTELGRTRAYELNREHVAAPIAKMLADLRPSLWEQFRATFRSWKVPALYACVFGSAARGDADAESDIDLLVVHAPFPGERHPRARSLTGFAAEFASAPLTTRQAARWQRQVDDLRAVAPRWSGNPLQALDLSTFEWAEQRRRATDLFREIDRDAIALVGHGPSTAQRSR